MRNLNNTRQRKPKIDHDNHKELWARYWADRTDPDALNDLALANYDLINWVIAHKCRAWLSFDRYDEYRQEGWFFLIRAIQHFRPGDGQQFSTYAVKALWSQMKNFYSRHESVIHFPAQWQTIRDSLRLAEDLYRQVCSKIEISNQELADFLGCNVELIAAMLDIKKLMCVESVDFHYGPESFLDYRLSDTLIHHLVDETSSFEDSVLDQVEEKEKPPDPRLILLRETCQTRLKDRERRVFYLKALEGLTLEEIGQQEGVTRESIRQTLKTAVDKLNAALGWEIDSKVFLEVRNQKKSTSQSPDKKKTRLPKEVGSLKLFLKLVQKKKQEVQRLEQSASSQP